MTDNTEENNKYPDHIIVIGGGRWARVLAEVLCDIVSSSVRITIHTFHNIDSILSWAKDKGFEERIQVLPEWPKLEPSILSAAIVVNAARDHENAIETVLAANIPVLVEKPVTLSFEATKRLVGFAQSQKTYFASAHIFLFASDIENFSKLVAKEENIQSVTMYWIDPKSESRYGEKKKYDPGLPVVVDCLPHVMSIVGSLMPSEIQSCKNIEFFRGGAHVEIELDLDEIPCNVTLIRNADRRQRIIEVVCGEKMLKLDFSKEPIKITDGSMTIKGDQNCDIKKRPSERMLSAFLHGVVTGVHDNRLNVNIGLRANLIIDQVLCMYKCAQINWMIEQCSGKVQDDEDLRYALSEILQLEGFLSNDELENKIERVRQQFFRSESKNSLTSLDDIKKFLKKIE